MPSLERVFNRLCNYAKKVKFISAITAKKAKREKLLAALKQPDNHKMIDPSTGNFLTVADMKEELAVIGQEITECNKHIAHANTSGRKDISWRDLHFALKDLGKPTPKVGSQSWLEIFSLTFTEFNIPNVPTGGCTEYDLGG